MRSLLVAALVLLGTTPVRMAQAVMSVMGCDEEVLTRQFNQCPPRGPQPDHGCDQCLPRNHSPLLPLFQIFCGPDHECRLRNPHGCLVCNGTCISVFRSGYTKWFVVLGDSEPVRNVITNCNQWLYQTYCNGVSGAYFVGEDMHWIPIGGQDYRDLPWDPLYAEVLAAYTGPGPEWIEDAWLYRIGVFAEMVHRADSETLREHYRRAALLSAWQYIFRAAPADQLYQVFAMAGFPADLDFDEFQDLIEIHEATCIDFPFLDCTDPVNQATWGGIKHLYRDP
jgi:hypothetical protein